MDYFHMINYNKLRDDTKFALLDCVIQSDLRWD